MKKKKKHFVNINQHIEALLRCVLVLTRKAIRVIKPTTMNFFNTCTNYQAACATTFPFQDTS